MSYSSTTNEPAVPGKLHRTLHLGSNTSACLPTGGAAKVDDEMLLGKREGKTAPFTCAK